MNRRNAFRLWKSTLLPTLMLLAFASANAQTTQFTYQGKLTDSGSVPNGSYDFQFKLYDTVTLGTGAQQGSTLTLPNITVTSGVFTVQLDFVACASCFNGADRFLEIAVKPTSGPTFTTLAPRQQIGSTPYALKSLNAAVADGLSVACVNCVTSSQIGSVNGSAVTGAVPVASVPAGSSNYIQNTTTQQPSSNFNISGNGVLGGSLGIGTNLPLGKLQAVTANDTNPSFITSWDSRHFVIGGAASSGGIGMSYDQTNQVGYIRALSPLVAFRNLVLQFGGGNVGIGTNNPSNARLVVQGNIGGGLFTVTEEFGTGVRASALGPTFGIGVSGDGASFGVSGSSTGGTGVFGSSVGGEGVFGSSSTGVGVFGQSSGTGVTGKSTGAGVGVYGESAQFEGVRGVAFDVNHGGVVGIHNGAGIAVYGTSGGTGVFGDSTSPTGHGGIFRNTAGGIALEVVGTASVGVLQITGGSDLAEHFEVTEEVKRGMVVAIDPKNAGKLSIARGAYNRRAAGVISGAKNLTAGMVLPDLSGAKESVPVALSGRVWVLCDASRNPIKPGDLLTTSNTPGHAMKVMNQAKAQGAIIGKAMTSLKSGRGLVLVLVTLQ